MYISKYAIIENDAKLYFGARTLYGYNTFNQAIYRLTFHRDITRIRFFRTIEAANKFIDSLPPTEEMLNVCTDTHGKRLKISNLQVVQISLLYDS